MLVTLAEKRLLPDAAIRTGIRRLLRARLETEGANALKDIRPRGEQIRDLFASGPIAEATDDARRQHYEAPTELFEAMLGPRLKYSACLWSPGARDLPSAEQAMLEATSQRAQLADRQRILDLGCGWGSFTLWAAERFPRAEIVAVSNSVTQHEFITATAQARGLKNVAHIVGDVATADDAAGNGDRALHLADLGQFDRIVSIEMFEHLRNVGRLIERLADSLRDDGRLFVHHFCHREKFYRYTDGGRRDWMARHFFTGGAMPPLDLLDHVAGPLRMVERWELGGEHYARTCHAWLANLDAARREVLARFRRDMTRADARRQLQRWRMFLMACEELFRHDNGRQWLVSHNLLAK